MLLQQFKEFVSQKQLMKPTEKLLLAVSGGVDSMVLLHLCKKAAYDISVAHVNFRLRGAAADADEALVIATCNENKIECFTTNFDTQAYANKNKLSIQMAARELRYNYFNALIKEHHFAKLVTAHHADDHIETFFINLLRSSGIQGLTGIPLQNEIIIRPLLFATKQQIETYAHTNSIKYNTDSSNVKDDYLRNNLRHHVIPAINNTSINAGTQILNSIQHLNDDANLLEELHQKAFEPLLSQHTHGISINKTKLLSFTNAAHLLFWHLKNYGFNSSQVQDMLSNEDSGRIFYSSTHQILQNRNELILSPITNNEPLAAIIIENINQKLETPIALEIELLELNNTIYKNAQVHEIFVDAAKIQFPLTLRKWQTGDQMQPLGMKHQKKVSDILIDNKVDNLTKANTYVLCNANNEIIWLIRQRVSESFKIDKNCKNVLHICSR
jgi:tRNA(Ile)-lysidine synthase